MSAASSEPDAAVSAVKPRFLHPALAVPLILAIFFICQILAVIVLGIAAGLTGVTTVPVTLFGSTIFAQFFLICTVGVLTLGVLAAFCRWRGITRADLGLTRPRWQDAVWAVGAFLVYMSALVIVTQVVSVAVPSIDLGQRQEIGFRDVAGLVPLALVFVSLVILPPLTEEILLRGFLFGALRARWRFTLATLVTSLVFAALHLNGGEQGAGLLWVAAIDTFVLSLALCYVRERTGRLWASIGLHAIKNGVAFLSLFVLASR